MNTEETVQGYEPGLKGLLRFVFLGDCWGETGALIGGGGGRVVNVHIFVFCLTANTNI